MRYIAIMFITFLIVGCNNSNEHPKVLNQKSKQKYANEILSSYTKNEQQNAKLEKEIALINMKKEIEKEKIRAQKELEIAKIQKSKEVEKNKIHLQEKKEENSITKIAIIIFSLISFAFLILLYFVIKKHHETKIAIEREKIRAQKEMKDKELKTQMATKLIDAMTSGKLTKEQEDKLLSLANGKNILEYKG